MNAPRLTFGVHAHCYQPPREEPWLELVPREPSAAPDHDWNTRITRECYTPLGAAPILDGAGHTRRIINTYAWMSFDVGPTLVHWLEAHAPSVLTAMVAGDRAAIARSGFGTAIAAPYHHVILPLASRRDKEIEVRWGIREFRRIFGREPLGLWLPETAVDEETLDVIAALGIRFTILAPHQVSTPDPIGAPLRWRAGHRELALIPYEGGLSHGVAFGDLLKNADRFHADIRERRSETGAVGSDAHTPVTIVAVDGETFGHHHRFGDLGIAALIDRVEHDPTIRWVTMEELVATTGDMAEAHLIPDTSWSCAHGIERWRSDCGCRMDPHTSQAWRAPLRAGLQQLSTALTTIISRDWPAEVGPHDAALDAAGPELEGLTTRSPAARRLLELERHRLAMFTSCGWFFDDLARIEPRIVLRHAARALDLVPAADRAPLESALIAELRHARANDPADGDGATLWTQDVVPGRLAVARLAAMLIAHPELTEFRLPAHDWRRDGDVVEITSRRTATTTRWRGEVIRANAMVERVKVREERGDEIVVAAADFPEIHAKSEQRTANG